MTPDHPKTQSTDLSDLDGFDFSSQEELPSQSIQHSDLESYKKMYNVLESKTKSENVPLKYGSYSIAQDKPKRQKINEPSMRDYEPSIRDYERQFEPSLSESQPVALSHEDKRRLSNKIKEMLSRKSQKCQLNSSQEGNTVSRLSLSQATQDFEKKSRARITLEVIEKIKIYFEQYNSFLDRPYQFRIKFKDIAEKVGISTSTVTALYDEYTKDPLFSTRLNKIEASAVLPPLYQNTQNAEMTYKRVQFLKKLILVNGPMTQAEIVNEMSNSKELGLRDKDGNVKPIRRRQILKYMRIAGFPLKQKNAIVQRNMNDPECIVNRFRYARKYLELTENSYSDICFLGEFSFASMMSLSSCPPVRRAEFIDGKAAPYRVTSAKEAKISVEDPEKWKIQYLLVLSLEGIVYYEIVGNMFRDINFPETLTNIGTAMNARHHDQKKYLILESCFLHKKNDLQAFERDSSIKVLFLPPLTPMLNPTEYFFNEVKSMVKSRGYKTGTSYSELLQQILKGFHGKNMQGYFACIAPYLELSLRHQPFK